MFKRSALLILFTFLLLSFGINAQAQERKATITYFEGGVEVLRAGETEWTKAKIKMDLEAGDKLRTALASKCEITLEDGSIITVHENTTIDLKELFSEEGAKKTKFKLWMGKVKVRAEKLRKGSSFQVETPTGLAGVRGTVWTIGYDDVTGITTVSVEKGEVYARGINQSEEEEVIVREGESADIYPEETGAPLHSIPGFTVRAELSPHPDFDWHNESPELTFVVTAETVLSDTPLIITVNEVEKARLFGGPAYAHTITDLYFVNQGRNDLVTSCGFLGGEDVLVTIPVYFDDIAPIITDPDIDFADRMFRVRIFGETGEEASGVRWVTVNGAGMSVVVQDEEYEIDLTGIDLSSSILIEAWDKAGINGNKGTLTVYPRDFDPYPPTVELQNHDFFYDVSQGYQLNLNVRVTDEESGVKEVTANGVNMIASGGNTYTATIGPPFYPVIITARDNAGNASRIDISGGLTPPPPPQP